MVARWRWLSSGVAYAQRSIGAMKSDGQTKRRQVKTRTGMIMAMTTISTKCVSSLPRSLSRALTIAHTLYLVLAA